MSADRRLKVVLCWHMHQPEYRDGRDGSYRLPWTYLHAIKDYVDMAAVLEEVPGARAVVNFVPILLDQIEDYARQVTDFLRSGTVIKDPLLAALAADAAPAAPEERVALVTACLRANEKRLVKRFPSYRRLAEMAALVRDGAEALAYFSEQFLADLLTWYHLAWLGETVRRADRRVQRLIEKGHRYTSAERRELLAIIGELLASVNGRYRALAERGQVELSMTPYAHPMLPLMLDFRCAREAISEAPLPECTQYPGAEERAHWHLREGLATFQRHFGAVPQGCWPAEGGVSEALLDLLEDYPFKWVATGGQVLRNSLAHSEVVHERPLEEKLHRAYQVRGKGPVCFFRDDGLSDLIGFTYSDWHGDDAVNNLIHHLENIARECRGQGDRVVAIILDGENAWESYPENGYHFLSALYRRLAAHGQLRLTTFTGCLTDGLKPHELPRLVAGSWVYGTFSTWIGDADKNRGWDLLCAAKRAYDAALAAGRLAPDQVERATQQLAACEGSDWFWWFGGYNPADSVSNFERLYRLHLSNLYRFLGETPPESLARAVSVGAGHPAQGGVMRPGQAQTV